MADIYITGHKNPDTDSVCSAYGYAEFKNKTDPDNNYIPVRCGHLNAQTKTVFEQSGVKPPAFIRDVGPKVSDVTRRDIVSLDVNDPVLKAIKVLDDENISCIPVFEHGYVFSGIVTIHQISSFLISENIGKRPVYRFRINNFMEVLPGFFYKRGRNGEFSAPIMTGAMPVEISRSRIDALKPDKPMLVVGLREEIIRTAVENEFPAIILTGIEDEQIPIDLSGYEGTVFISKADTAETIRLLRLSAPVKDIMNREPEVIQADSDFDTAKNFLVKSTYRGLPVFENGIFSGIVTRRCFIEKPLRKLILVDHNETAQSVPGAEQADIIEIIDHHRLSPPPTRMPIYMNIRPVGSTSTIVFSHFRERELELSKETARLLLAGILSDTLILRSPTTTDEDIKSAGMLAEICGLEVESFGKELMENSSVLGRVSASEIIESDFKLYSEGDIDFGVGQTEVTSLARLDEVRAELIEALNNIKSSKKLDWAMLLVTDVIKENSVLLTTSFPEAESLLAYKKLDENLFDLPGILSRKKQLLPELLRVAEAIKNA